MPTITLPRIAEDFTARVTAVEPLLFLTRDSRLQRDAIAALEQLVAELEGYRAAAAAKRAETEANILLGLRTAANGLIEELRVYLLLKAEDPDQAWDALVRSQAAFAAAMRAHASFAYLAAKADHLRALERYLFPPIQFVSAGLIVREQVCSICRADYSACDHLAGRPYCGQFCTVILKQAEPDHIALVDEPANRHCRITAIGTATGRRNVMTWRVTPPKAGDTPYVEGELIADSIIATTSHFGCEEADGAGASAPAGAGGATDIKETGDGGRER